MRNHHRVIVAAGLLLVLATACNGSSTSGGTSENGRSVLQQAAAATAAGSGTVRGDGRLTGGPATFRGGWSGTFADGRGRTDGSVATASGKAPLEVVWRDGMLYSKRSDQAKVNVPGVLGQALTGDAGQPSWVRSAASEPVARVFAPFSPPDLLTALALNGTVSESDGPTIRGADTRRVVVEDHRGLLFQWIGTKRAVVLLDGQDRLVRATIESAAESLRIDVRYGKAPEVTVPSEADLTVETPRPPTPVAPFESARSGATGATTWTLQQAAGSSGTTCWRWTSAPPMRVVRPSYQTDTRCVADPTAEDPIEEQVNVVMWTDGSTPEAAVVASLPAGFTRATLGYVGGRTETVDVTEGPNVWVGPSSEPLGYLGLSNGSVTVNCGIGPVATADDLTNPQLESADTFQMAWSCQAA